jgi:ketosteroid isomerase-like protein
VRHAIGVFLCVLSCACASAPGARQLSALRAASEAYTHASGFRSADSIARFFAENVVVMSPQGRQPVHGREANREAWRRFFSGTNPEHTMTTDSVAMDRGGTMAWTLGRWTVGVDTPSGRAAASGHYLAVWQKRGEQWLITAVTAYPFR